MVTMELLVYPALTILMLMLIYAFVGPRDQIIRYITHNLDINVDKCASEDCVRYVEEIKETGMLVERCLVI